MNLTWLVNTTAQKNNTCLNLLIPTREKVHFELCSNYNKLAWEQNPI